MRMRYFGAHRSALEMLANLLIGVDEQNDVCISTCIIKFIGMKLLIFFVLFTATTSASTPYLFQTFKKRT